MADRQRIITGFFQGADPDGSYDHHSPDGVSADAIAKVEASLGIRLHDELREFYSHSDGLGLVSREEDEEIPLLVRPISDLPEFIKECRAWFSKTHPEYAAGYFPFNDWYDGDSSGYVLNSDGELLEDVFTFHHELYEYDTNQDINEFLKPQAKSLEALLSPN